MALNNLFDMVKADRYTQDGREALIKAQEAETEDVKYNIGDISQKTGLQKTANGWVKPKSGKQPGKTDKPNPNGVTAQQKQKLEAEKHEAARRDAQAPSKKTEVNTPGLRKDVQEAIKRSSPEEIKAYIKELRTPGSRMSRYFDNPDLLANVYEDELNKMAETKPAAESKPAGSGVAIQGSNWFSLPSGTRITHEGAREKLSQNNERIETIKKMMEGKSKADNFRLGSELKSLQNENEYIAERLPPEKTETPSATGSAQSTIKYEDAQKAINNGQVVQWKDSDGVWHDVDPKTSELVMARDIGSKLRVKTDENGNPVKAKPEPGMDETRSKLLELEKRRKKFEKYPDMDNSIKLQQAALLSKAGFGSRAEFEEFANSEMPSDSAPRVLTGDTRIRVRKA